MDSLTLTGQEGVPQILIELQALNSQFVRECPYAPLKRQPVHTFYGGANLFKAGSKTKLSKLALESLKTYAPNFVALAQILQFKGYETLPKEEHDIQSLVEKTAKEGPDGNDRAVWLASTVYTQLLKKLSTDAVEDMRVDFEDGFGPRSDAEEDACAQTAAEEMALGMEGQLLPEFIGIRIKSFNNGTLKRGLRTLDLFLTTLLNRTKGRLPPHFAVTLPKVNIPAQVKTLVKFLEIFEKRYGFLNGTLKMEMMVETPRALWDSRGNLALPAFIHAAEGRCLGLHLGPYDFTAACDLTVQNQKMDHALCDFARHLLKLYCAGTDINVVDGPTNVMPVGPHKGDVGPLLSLKNTKAVHGAWKLSYNHIRHSLEQGIYQGWDLHPAQIPVRFAACYSFFLEGLDETLARLKNFMEKSAQATLTGNIFDDAATGQGLISTLFRAYACGAITHDQIQAGGMTLQELEAFKGRIWQNG